MYYINKKQEHLLILFKVEPIIFLRNILVYKAKEVNLILLKECDIYLKNLYDSLGTMGNTIKIPIEEDIFFFGGREVWDYETHLWES